MNRSFVRYALLLILAAFPALVAAAPRLSYVYPIGYERGKKVTLNIVGQELAGEIEIQSKIPGTLTLKPVDVVDGKPAYDENQRRDVEVEIPADAPVGVYPLRVRTADGVSNHVLFSVGSLPDVGEVEPNNQVEQPQVVNLGSTILGSVGPADRDIYKLTLPAGTRLVAEVEARRIGMPIDSVLTVLDAQGHELASSDDALGLDADSRVDVTLGRAGDYFVIINDVNYQQSSSYRLKIGSYDYAEAIFPLGAPKGSDAQVWAWSQEKGEQPVVVSTADAERWTMVQPMGSTSPSLPFRFVVSTGPEIVESAGQLPDLVHGQTANGRIAAPGEKDLYRLVTAPGERWRFSLSARKLGSPLDAAVTVENKDGAPLVRSVDQVDPVFDFVVPADTNEVRLAVEDLHGRGGPSFGYRLSVQKLSVDFGMEVVPDVVNIPESSQEYVAVRVDRRGYDGPIQLYIPENISGVTADAGLIPAGQNEGYILLSAAPGTKPTSVPLEIWGRGGTPARPLDRRASGSSANVSPYVAASLLDPMPAALCRAKPLGVEVSTRDLRVVHGFGGKLDVTVKRGEGVAGDIRLEPKIRIPSFPQGLETPIPKDQSAASIQFPGNVELGLSEGTMLFEAVATVNGREFRVTLPPIFVKMVRPFSAEIIKREITLPPTGEANLDLVIRRENVFNGEVVVQAEDLPKGISAAQLTVAPANTTAALLFKTEGAEPGTYTIKIRFSADIEGRKRSKMYDLPLEEVRLVVSPPATGG